MKLTEIFASEQGISEEKLKVKDLRFGTHVQRGGHLPNRDDSSLKIFSQDTIDRWIYNNELTGEEEVILDPSAEAWFDKVKIPALEKDREEFVKGKAQSLKQLGTTNEDLNYSGDTATITIPEEYNVRNFAEDVAQVLKDSYGERNYETFISTLQNKL